MSNDTQEILVERKEAMELIELRTKLDRLRKNPDFQAIIEDKYFEQEPVRLVQLLAVPQFADKKDSIHEQMMAISLFREFLRSVYSEANYAEKMIEDADAALADESEE